MDLLGAGLFAEADDHHLAETALHLSGETGMRLHPVHDHHPVGFARISIEVDRDHERLRACLADRGCDLAHRDRQVRDATAAAGNRDPLAGADAGKKGRNLAAGGRGDVRLLRAVEVLADAHQGRNVVGGDSRLAIVEPERLAKCYRGAQVCAPRNASPSKCSA